ncbi:uncharacterized protein PHALS_10876 [Plasmopara halstedii]|uniref:Uncharacterized protein n=1 Tax=Plasmopara halstedii TaxID=4781 RepID=A0A0P1AIH1_PLAHL|nr:uncharacterized protein PHALS_10876 [Plasmopara halstedii]CEG40692.1 hypothetical protein PHALS_10876 [Plasmopara halstedii]|eukprot:XP_024577061.1 hypothetical protein PHALS_10876 [Plasmopara halstedii]
MGPRSSSVRFLLDDFLHFFKQDAYPFAPMNQDEVSIPNRSCVEQSPTSCKNLLAGSGVP